MARQLTNLTIFVSGPDDAEAEKSALKRVIADLGEDLERTHAITLRLIGWPDTIRPGVGADPQSVINQQVGQAFDIYIGILGTRFGQPTPRAESGTEEEFISALKRFHLDTTSVRVLFYFKRTEQDPFTIDLDQMQKVKQFREGLGAQGVLYSDFNNTTEFIERARKHLHNLVVEEWQNGCWTKVQITPIQQCMTIPEIGLVPSPTKSVVEGIEEEEERGLIELLKDLEQRGQAANDLILRMGAHTVAISQQLQERTIEANQLVERYQALEHIGGSREKQEYLSLAITVANQAANDLEQFSASLEPDIKQYRDENRVLLDSLDKAMGLQREFQMPPDRGGPSWLDSMFHFLSGASQ